MRARALLLLLPLLFAPSRSRAKMGEKVRFSTEDGWSLSGDYAQGDSKHPVFVLVHGVGGRRQDWEPLRKALWARGYGVLSFDLRGHGESTQAPGGSTQTWRSFSPEGQDNDWNRMSLDLDAAAKFLAERGVPVSSVAVAGASLGANLALKWAAVKPQVIGAILISPGINYKDVLSIGAMRAYGRRPVLLVSGQDDRSVLLATKLIYDNARYHSGEAYAKFWAVPGKEGARLLTPDVIERILLWLAAPVSPQAPAPAVSSAPAPGAVQERALAPSATGLVLPGFGGPARR